MDPDDDEEGDATTGDKLQLRLLLMEDKQRSQLMWRQVTAFQDKVTLCLNTFKPEALLQHVRALASLPSQNQLISDSIHSQARLRMVVQQQLRRASMRSDGSVYFPGEQEASVAARCTQYFVWFFEFMDYLNELHSNFVERIFLPLFKFFHEISFLGSQGRASTSGSTFSKFSQFSLESAGETTEDNENINRNRNNNSAQHTGGGGGRERGGGVGVGGGGAAPRSVSSREIIVEDREGSWGSSSPSSLSPMKMDVDMDVDTARRRAQSRTALMLLSKEFRDIRVLYDTTEMDRVAQRLAFIKDQVDFMLEEEDELDPDLFSTESGQLLYPLDMDEGTENLVRLPVDLLVKYRKAVWLARRWLELYDQRTCDLNSKLQKVLSLEETLGRKLRSLDGDISQHERELEQRTDELHRLMGREERCEALNFALYDLDSKTAALKRQMEQLRKERDSISGRILSVTQKGQAHRYRSLKLEFEKNRLQRYLLERQLATLRYQGQLSHQDHAVELEVRPSLIRYTNHVQDTCERLEQRLRQEKNERDRIRNALIPIQEDRQMLSDRLSRSSSMRVASSRKPDHHLRSGEARFVRTYNMAGKSSGIKTFQSSPPSSSPSLRGRNQSGTTTKAAAPGWMSPPEW